jgi:hypothetical protein
MVSTHCLVVGSLIGRTLRCPCTYEVVQLLNTPDSPPPSSVTNTFVTAA